MAQPDCCYYVFEQPNRQHQSHLEDIKRDAYGQYDPCPYSRPNAPLHWHAMPLSPRHDIEPHYWSTNDTEDEDDIGNFSSSEPKLIQNDDLQFQRLEAKKHALAMFKDWKENTEYIAPPENELPFQRRFRSSPRQSMADIKTNDEYDTSDDELVVISHPARRSKASFHLACPFYTYDPEKCHQCLLTGDLRSISDVSEHLFQFHSRPCYCMNCYETFDTQILRDDHVLNEKCEERTPGPLFGLAESQKAKLLDIDTHCSSEKACWFDIWSIVFPDSREPRSPYLDRGIGLGVSMMRDFWDLHGSRCILESSTLQGIPRCEHRGIAGNLYELVLQDLLNNV
ncbi:hypothetical protein FPHYL_5406 [Fusarium phyllophilum]|uniref:C2H2-type domain-containing protein n=1 Tax=Fusarium phyllophilum TaxID=47803 RepID=A0A8H5K0Y5_9HYPO|nr:hypothetical protein FPHYL_5406 [Fusarium phyllophilum]